MATAEIGRAGQVSFIIAKREEGSGSEDFSAAQPRHAVPRPSAPAMVLLDSNQHPPEVINLIFVDCRLMAPRRTFKNGCREALLRTRNGIFFNQSFAASLRCLKQWTFTCSRSTQHGRERIQHRLRRIGLGNKLVDCGLYFCRIIA